MKATPCATTGCVPIRSLRLEAPYLRPVGRAHGVEILVVAAKDDQVAGERRRAVDLVLRLEGPAFRAGLGVERVEPVVEGADVEDAIRQQRLAIDDRPLGPEAPRD